MRDRYNGRSGITVSGRLEAVLVRRACPEIDKIAAMSTDASREYNAVQSSLQAYVVAATHAGVGRTDPNRLHTWLAAAPMRNVHRGLEVADCHDNDSKL